MDISPPSAWRLLRCQSHPRPLSATPFLRGISSADLSQISSGKINSTRCHLVFKTSIYQYARGKHTLCEAPHPNKHVHTPFTIFHMTNHSSRHVYQLAASLKLTLNVEKGMGPWMARPCGVAGQVDTRRFLAGRCIPFSTSGTDTPSLRELWSRNSLLQEQIHKYRLVGCTAQYASHRLDARPYFRLHDVPSWSHSQDIVTAIHSMPTEPLD